jgi:hypothetical protein
MLFFYSKISKKTILKAPFKAFRESVIFFVKKCLPLWCKNR